jgi:AcrR family transcriptional regulator
MPRQPGRSADATKERILDAAVEVLARRGYDGAGVDEIVRRSGASKGAFYFHFPSKEEMVLRLVHQMSDKLIDAVREAIAGTPPSRERLGLAVTALVETFGRKRVLGQLLLVNIVGQGRTLDRKFLPVRRKFGEFIRGEMDAAVGAGALPSSLDTELASQAWLGAFHEVLLRWLIDEDPVPLAERTPALCDLLLNGVGGRENA